MLLDAGGVDTPLDPELLLHLTVLSPNETELQRITGLPTATEDDLLAAAHALQQSVQQQQQVGKQHEAAGDKHQLQVLLKLGTAGSMSVPGRARESAEGPAGVTEGVVRQAAVLAPEVIDTTGKDLPFSCWGTFFYGY